VYCIPHDQPLTAAVARIMGRVWGAETDQNVLRRRSAPGLLSEAVVFSGQPGTSGFWCERVELHARAPSTGPGAESEATLPFFYRSREASPPPSRRHRLARSNAFWRCKRAQSAMSTQVPTPTPDPPWRWSLKTFSFHHRAPPDRHQGLSPMGMVLQRDGSRGFLYALSGDH